jgi:hypothetical protein
LHIDGGLQASRGEEISKSKQTKREIHDKMQINEHGQLGRSIGRTLMRSRGCPTRTTQIPPTPPDRKLLRADSAVDTQTQIEAIARNNKDEKVSRMAFQIHFIVSSSHTSRSRSLTLGSSNDGDFWLGLDRRHGTVQEAALAQL